MTASLPRFSPSMLGKFEGVQSCRRYLHTATTRRHDDSQDDTVQFSDYIKERGNVFESRRLAELRATSGRPNPRVADFRVIDLKGNGPDCRADLRALTMPSFWDALGSRTVVLHAFSIEHPFSQTPRSYGSHEPAMICPVGSDVRFRRCEMDFLIARLVDPDEAAGGSQPSDTSQPSSAGEAASYPADTSAAGSHGSAGSQSTGAGAAPGHGHGHGQGPRLDGRYVEITVADTKASAYAKPEHAIQLACYVLVLQWELAKMGAGRDLTSAGVSSSAAGAGSSSTGTASLLAGPYPARVSEIAEVWLPSGQREDAAGAVLQDSTEIEVPLHVALDKVLHMFSTVLPEISSQSEEQQPWRLAPHCSGCHNLPRCEAQAVYTDPTGPGLLGEITAEENERRGAATPPLELMGGQGTMAVARPGSGPASSPQRPAWVPPGASPKRTVPETRLRWDLRGLPLPRNALEAVHGLWLQAAAMPSGQAGAGSTLGGAGAGGTVAAARGPSASPPQARGGTLAGPAPSPLAGATGNTPGRAAVAASGQAPPYPTDVEDLCRALRPGGHLHRWLRSDGVVVPPSLAHEWKRGFGLELQDCVPKPAPAPAPQQPRTSPQPSPARGTIAMETDSELEDGQCPDAPPAQHWGPPPRQSLQGAQAAQVQGNTLTGAVIQRTSLGQYPQDDRPSLDSQQDDHAGMGVFGAAGGGAGAATAVPAPAPAPAPTPADPLAHLPPLLQSRLLDRAVPTRQYSVSLCQKEQLAIFISLLPHPNVLPAQPIAWASLEVRQDVDGNIIGPLVEDMSVRHGEQIPRVAFTGKLGSKAGGGSGSGASSAAGVSRTAVGAAGASSSSAGASSSSGPAPQPPTEASLVREDEIHVYNACWKLVRKLQKVFSRYGAADSGAGASPSDVPTCRLYVADGQQRSLLRNAILRVALSPPPEDKHGRPIRTSEQHLRMASVACAVLRLLAGDDPSVLGLPVHHGGRRGPAHFPSDEGSEEGDGDDGAGAAGAAGAGAAGLGAQALGLGGGDGDEDMDDGRQPARPGAAAAAGAGAANGGRARSAPRGAKGPGVASGAAAAAAGGKKGPREYVRMHSGRPKAAGMHHIVSLLPELPRVVAVPCLGSLKLCDALLYLAPHGVVLPPTQAARAAVQEALEKGHTLEEIFSKPTTALLACDKTLHTLLDMRHMLSGPLQLLKPDDRVLNRQRGQPTGQAGQSLSMTTAIPAAAVAAHDQPVSPPVVRHAPSTLAARPVAQQHQQVQQQANAGTATATAPQPLTPVALTIDWAWSYMINGGFARGMWALHSMCRAMLCTLKGARALARAQMAGEAHQLVLTSQYRFTEDDAGDDAAVAAAALAAAAAAADGDAGTDTGGGAGSPSSASSTATAGAAAVTGPSIHIERLKMLCQLELFAEAESLMLDRMEYKGVVRLKCRGSSETCNFPYPYTRESGTESTAFVNIFTVLEGADLLRNGLKGNDDWDETRPPDTDLMGQAFGYDHQYQYCLVEAPGQPPLEETRPARGAPAWTAAAGGRGTLPAAIPAQQPRAAAAAPGQATPAEIPELVRFRDIADRQYEHRQNRYDMQKARFVRLQYLYCPLDASQDPGIPVLGGRPEIGPDGAPLPMLYADCVGVPRDNDKSQPKIDPGCLASALPLKRDRIYLLFERVATFNHSKVEAALQALDDPLELAKLPLMYALGHGVSFREPQGDDADTYTRAVKSFEAMMKVQQALSAVPTTDPSIAADVHKLRLKHSQIEAVSEVVTQPIAVLWGPPGTGKTHTLAVGLLRWIRAVVTQGLVPNPPAEDVAEARTRQVRILITAVTNKAIVELKDRIEKMRKVYCHVDEAYDSELQWKGRVKTFHFVSGDNNKARNGVMKALKVARGAHANFTAGAGAEAGTGAAGGPTKGKPTGKAVEVQHVIACGTVWQLYKMFKTGKAVSASDVQMATGAFDMIIVDEASQMRLTDLAVVLPLLKPEGRVVAAGDHLQLSPILHGQYDVQLHLPVHKSVLEVAACLRAAYGMWLKEKRAAEGAGLAFHSPPVDDYLKRLATMDRSPGALLHSPSAFDSVHEVIMLTENSRANMELTELLQQTYGSSYQSQIPHQQLHWHDDLTEVKQSRASQTVYPWTRAMLDSIHIDTKKRLLERRGAFVSVCIKRDESGFTASTTTAAGGTVVTRVTPDRPLAMAGPGQANAGGAGGAGPSLPPPLYEDCVAVEANLIAATIVDIIKYGQVSRKVEVHNGTRTDLKETRVLQQAFPPSRIKVVTPHNVQKMAVRRAIQAACGALTMCHSIVPDPSPKDDGTTSERTYLQQLILDVDTVERHQGGEADVVIVAMGSLLEPSKVEGEAEFLYTRERINVAVSRAQAAVLLLYTEPVMSPPLSAVLHPQAGLGLQFLHGLLQHSRARGMDMVAEVQVPWSARPGVAMAMKMGQGEAPSGPPATVHPPRLRQDRARQAAQQAGAGSSAAGGGQGVSGEERCSGAGFVPTTDFAKSVGLLPNGSHGLAARRAPPGQAAAGGAGGRAGRDAAAAGAANAATDAGGVNPVMRTPERRPTNGTAFPSPHMHQNQGALAGTGVVPQAAGGVLGYVPGSAGSGSAGRSRPGPGPAAAHAAGGTPGSGQRAQPGSGNGSRTKAGAAGGAAGGVMFSPYGQGQAAPTAGTSSPSRPGFGPATPVTGAAGGTATGQARPGSGNGSGNRGMPRSGGAGAATAARFVAGMTSPPPPLGFGDGQAGPSPARPGFGAGPDLSASPHRQARPEQLAGHKTPRRGEGFGSEVTGALGPGAGAATGGAQPRPSPQPTGAAASAWGRPIPEAGRAGATGLQPVVSMPPPPPPPIRVLGGPPQGAPQPQPFGGRPMHLPADANGRAAVYDSSQDDHDAGAGHGAGAGAAGPTGGAGLGVAADTSSSSAGYAAHTQKRQRKGRAPGSGPPTPTATGGVHASPGKPRPASPTARPQLTRGLSDGSESSSGLGTSGNGAPTRDGVEAAGGVHVTWAGLAARGIQSAKGAAAGITAGRAPLPVHGHGHGHGYGHARDTPPPGTDVDEISQSLSQSQPYRMDEDGHEDGQDGDEEDNGDVGMDGAAGDNRSGYGGSSRSGSGSGTGPRLPVSGAVGVAKRGPPSNDTESDASPQSQLSTVLGLEPGRGHGRDKGQGHGHGYGQGQGRGQGQGQGMADDAAAMAVGRTDRGGHGSAAAGGPGATGAAAVTAGIRGGRSGPSGRYARAPASSSSESSGSPWPQNDRLGQATGLGQGTGQSSSYAAALQAHAPARAAVGFLAPRPDHTDTPRGAGATGARPGAAGLARAAQASGAPATAGVAGPRVLHSLRAGAGGQGGGVAPPPAVGPLAQGPMAASAAGRADPNPAPDTLRNPSQSSASGDEDEGYRETALAARGPAAAGAAGAGRAGVGNLGAAAAGVHTDDPTHYRSANGHGRGGGPAEGQRSFAAAAAAGPGAQTGPAPRPGARPSLARATLGRPNAQPPPRNDDEDDDDVHPL